MNTQVERESNVELLRIILMMMVITLHFNIPSGHAIELASNEPINLNILNILESFSICAVDTFVLITGYFNCKSTQSRMSKVISLLMQVAVYNLITYSIKVAIGSATFSIGQLIIHLFPSNWYISIYIALYLLAPYINYVICSLSREKFRVLLLCSFILFSVNPTVLTFVQDYMGWNVDGLSAISIAGAGNGYTLINFILMYIIGAYIRIQGVKLSIKPQVLFVLLAGIIFVGNKYLYGYSEMFYDYCNLFIVLESVVLFLIFQNLKIASVKVINILSKYAFSVYLLHGEFYILFNVKRIVTANPLIMIGMIGVVCLTLYMIPWMIGCIYHFLTKPLQKILLKKDYIIKIES